MMFFLEIKLNLSELKSGRNEAYERITKYQLRQRTPVENTV